MKVEDRSQEIFSQYELNINHTYRVRGAILLDTNQGLKLFCSCNSSEHRLEFEDALKQQMKQNGYINTDCFIRNNLGTIATTNNIGERFLIKDWFDGEECNIKKEEKILNAVDNLALLHNAMEGIETAGDLKPFHLQQKLPELFEKRTREMKRVMSYIRNRKMKSIFEANYLNMCEEFYDEAVTASERLAAMPYDRMYDYALESGCVCHGSYNYHNILLLNQNTHVLPKVMAADIKPHFSNLATTNFEKATYGIPITDLYQFIRKIMEKANWDIGLGNQMIKEYTEIRNTTEEELKLLSILLLYPEKFWKITNFYYNNKKSWIPQKNIQKLLTIRGQQDKKREFLKQYGENLLC